jgi:sugar phosphate isomerase/epimerase
VYTGPLGDRLAAEADTTCRRWLADALPLARKFGVGLMLEPMFPMMSAVTYVHSLQHALLLVEPFDDVKVVVDTAHLWWEPDLVELVRDHVERIGSIQLSNVSSEAIANRTLRRAPLGNGVVPLRDFIRAFDDAGYRGWYEHEVITDDVGDRVEFVRQEREWFERLFE